MLRLTRKAAESIVIGDSVEVTVLDFTLHGTEMVVELGIIAPGLAIDRKEIRIRKQQQKRQAAGGNL